MIVDLLLSCVFLGTHVIGTHALEPQENFDLEKFSGEWYRIGLADESPLFAMLKDQMKVSKGLLVTDDGNVNLTMWSMRPYGCALSVYSYEKTDIPGVFTYYSKRHRMTKDVTVVDTNYTDYSFVFKYKAMDREFTQLALYGRSSVLKPEIIEKFRSLALSVGFTEGAIAIPAEVDPCPLVQDARNTGEFREERPTQTANQSLSVNDKPSEV